MWENKGQREMSIDGSHTVNKKFECLTQGQTEMPVFGAESFMQNHAKLEVAHALISLSFPKGFIKAFLKARWESEGPEGCVINLCTILWLADGEVTG